MLGPALPTHVQGHSAGFKQNRICVNARERGRVDALLTAGVVAGAIGGWRGSKGGTCPRSTLGAP